MNKAQALYIVDDVVASSKTETHRDNLILIPALPDFTKEQNAEFEYEFLGFYLTNNPLHEYKKKLSLLCSTQRMKEKSVGERVVIGGRLAECKVLRTKRDNREMAHLVIEDLTGRVEGVIFPYAFAKNAQYLKQNNLVELKGKVDVSTWMLGDEEKTKYKLIVDSIVPMEELENVRAILIKFNDVNTITIDKILGILINFPGDIDVGLELRREKLFAMLTDYKISYEGLLELEKFTIIERIK